MLPIGSSIPDVETLERLLADPRDQTVEALARLDGDIVVLGVGGKMGPTLAWMAKLASEAAGTRRTITGVARFSDPGVKKWLEARGIRTLACDLLDPEQYAGLPDAPNVVFMAGMKFGATGNEPLTWAMNSYVPTLTCQRYRGSRISAFSTGNVYGLTRLNSPSREADTPNPVGEYAMSTLARERMFQYFSSIGETKVALIRLNYAVEMRYGVLMDIAQRVWAGAPVDVTVPAASCIWQADASSMALEALVHAESPARAFNITGPETLHTRETAQAFGILLGKQVLFSGSESELALLSDTSAAEAIFGKPRISAEQVMALSADWLKRGGATWDKPTHFEALDGKF